MRAIPLAVMLCLAGCAQAQSVSVTMIDTPHQRHTFGACQIMETVLQRHATVATVVMHCGQHSATPNSGWQPSEHPDNAPMLWESRVRTRADQEPFLECTLLHLTDSPGYRLLHFECLDDPLLAAPAVHGRVSGQRI